MALVSIDVWVILNAWRWRNHRDVQRRRSVGREVVHSPAEEVAVVVSVCGR